MQVLEHWDPLNLPRGSVRAIMALALLGILWAFMLMGREIPLPLAFVTLVILGHYFGVRGAEVPGGEGASGGKSPLYLPRGSVRTLIILGFAAVGALLWHQGNLEFTPQSTVFTIFLLAAAFLAGFLLRKTADFVTRGKMTRPRRWYENFKAIVALSATGLFVLACIVGTNGPREQNLALLCAPLIVFYFGSRQ
jgi:hypothetical protein